MTTGAADGDPDGAIAAGVAIAGRDGVGADAGLGTFGMAALGSGVGIAGRAGIGAAGVGRAVTAGGSEGVRKDADDWKPASGSNPASGASALGTPLPGVIRARHLPPSCAARTAKAPSEKV